MNYPTFYTKTVPLLMVLTLFTGFLKINHARAEIVFGTIYTKDGELRRVCINTETGVQCTNEEILENY